MPTNGFTDEAPKHWKTPRSEIVHDNSWQLHLNDVQSIMRFSSIRSSTYLSAMFHSYSSLDDHCLLLLFLCRLGCSTVSALWPATTPWACSASGRGSASCWHPDTSSPSRSSSGVRQMTTWWWDALTARCTSGRWTQVRTEWLECVFFCSFSLELGKCWNTGMK